MKETSSDLAVCDSAWQKREEKCPKATCVGHDVLKMGVYSVIIGSNEGTSLILNVLIESAIEPGNFSKLYCRNTDNERVRIMEYKSKESIKLSRKKLRNRRKGFQDNCTEKEGEVYGSGLF